jgi:uncharacterized protein (TIGR02271 family)
MEQQNAQLVPGAVVETNDGRLGLIDRVETKPGRKKPTGVYVWLGQSDQPTLIPLNEIKSVRSMEDVNRLATHQLPLEQDDRLDADATTLLEREGEIRIPLAAERLNIARQVVNLGELRIHKRVEQVEEVQRVPVTHDELVVERVAMNQPLSAPLEPRIEGGQLIIPIMKEVLVVQRQLVLVEEVRVSKRYITEQHEVREPVRRERVELEDASIQGERPLQPGELDRAFQEETIRVPVRGEQAVVSKEAVVTGEVVVRKEQHTEQQQVTGTTRRVEVQVDKNYDKLRSNFQQNWQQNYAKSGRTWETDEPNYQYGYAAGTNQQYQGQSWAQVEPELQRSYAQQYGDDSRWQELRAEVQQGFEGARSGGNY